MRLLAAALLLLLGSGCSQLDYYAQATRGHWQLLQASRPIEHILADPDQPQALRTRLQQVLDVRHFASQSLGLPDNRSYQAYADIGRPFVVWNVFATPEFSLEPLTHCFAIAGCVAYRGYYQPARARGLAARLQIQGMDTAVVGVDAYSTLGWLPDPLPSSLLRHSDERLAGVIFHELAHQQYYLKGDTAFNESFASFVERQGLAQWQGAARHPPPSEADQRQRQFTELVLATRQRLQQLYRQPLPATQLRQLKQAEFDRLAIDYQRLRDQHWQGDRRYDGWFDKPLNNARLLPFGLYDQWVDAFARLFEHSGRDWPRFYDEVSKLGMLPTVQRHARLQQLLDAHAPSP